MQVLNGWVGQLRAGQLCRSHRNHPSIWRMITRNIGAINLRNVETGRDTTVPLSTRVWIIDEGRPSTWAEREER